MIWLFKIRMLAFALIIVAANPFVRSKVLLQDGVARPSQTDTTDSITNANFLRDLNLGLIGICAVDQSNLWAIANATSWVGRSKSRSGTAEQPVLPSNQGIILRSSDGGESWVIQHIEKQKFFIDIQFVSRTTGWILESSDFVLKTTDGGSSWHRQRQPSKSSWCDLHFFDDSRGWVLAADGKVSSTQDGGREWKLSQIRTTQRTYSICSRDQNSVWVIGDNGTLYQSIDSGIHWQDRGNGIASLIPSLSTHTIVFRAMKFINSSVGFIAASVLSKNGEFDAKAVLFKTVDGGRIWVPTIVNNALGISSAAFPSEQEVYIVPGGRSQQYLLRSRDGGKSWSTLALPHNAGPGQLVFVDSNNGWLLNFSDTFSSDQIFRTKDGATSWIGFNIPSRISN